MQLMKASTRSKRKLLRAFPTAMIKLFNQKLILHARPKIWPINFMD